MFPKVNISQQWLNFGYMELTKTEAKGAHLIEGVARVLQMIYIPALTNYMTWGDLPGLQVGHLTVIWCLLFCFKSKHFIIGAFLTVISNKSTIKMQISSYKFATLPSSVSLAEVTNSHHLPPIEGADEVGDCQ